MVDFGRFCEMPITHVNWPNLDFFSRYLVEYVQELPGQEEEEAGKEHGLDVGDELRLADQPVQPGTLLQSLYNKVHLNKGYLD